MTAENPASTSWTSTELAKLGVRVDFVGDGEVKELEVEDLRRASQTHQTFSMGVDRGTGADLESFVSGQRMAGTVEEKPTTADELCGQSGQRQELAVGPHAGRGSRLGPDGQIVHGGAEGSQRVAIVVAADIKGDPLRAWYIVDADKREANAEIEKHFFASIECL